MQDSITLEEMLKQSKAHPFKVQLDFDRRFRVWQEVILGNRRQHIATERMPIDEKIALVQRYVLLDIKDAHRLYKRAQTEFLFIAEKRKISNFTLIGFKNLYWHREKLIFPLLWQQLRFYERESGLDIISSLWNNWIELKE